MSSPSDKVRYLYRASGLDLISGASAGDEVLVDTRSGSLTGPYAAGDGVLAAGRLNAYVARSGVTPPPFRAGCVSDYLE